MNFNRYVIHYDPDDAGYWSLCGKISMNYTSDVSEVSCHNCRRVIKGGWKRIDKKRYSRRNYGFK